MSAVTATPVKMAAVIRDALSASKTPLTAPAGGAPPPIDLDTAQLDQIIGLKGQNNGGVYQFAVPRRDPVSEGDMQLAPVGPMGVAEAIGFQPTGGGKAAITGDFVLTADRSQPCDQDIAKQWDRGNRAAQPHAGRAAHVCSSAISGPTTMR